MTVGTRLRREHDVPLPSGTMSVYIAERRPDAPAGVAVEPAEPHVLRISRDLKSLASALGGTAEPPFITDIEGQLYVAGVVGCEGFDLQVLVGPAYPFTPPVVIAARRPEAKGDLAEPRLGLRWNGDDAPVSQGLRLAWDLDTPDETRLLAALLAAGQAPDAPPAALVAGQAALTAAQAALAAGQAALAAGQAALVAEQPEPEAELEAELAKPEAELEAAPEAEDAEETEPASELAALAVDEAEPEADETETDAELGEPDAEPAEPEAEEVEAYAELAVVAAEEAESDAEPEADHAPDTGPDTLDDGAISGSSPGWFGRLLQRIKQVLNPGSWRRRAAAQPVAATDSEAEAVPEAIPDDDLAAVQGSGQADD